ncbi:MAG: response regulator [Lachnospiraceae bacterium]|nr:response regulator [Lachnospiraceae bacterium]MDE7205087.1 response regulator [Lachnospiraceae bacterium]
MRIVICDDEKEIRESYAGKIRQLYPHADLVQYQSGKELLTERQKPDILLLDIHMPGRNGMETERQLRRKNDG